MQLLNTLAKILIICACFTQLSFKQVKKIKEPFKTIKSTLLQLLNTLNKLKPTYLKNIISNNIFPFFTLANYF